MLGLGSFEIALAFYLCIAAAVWCIIYGLVNWNKTGLTSQEMRAQVEWAKRDREMDETIS